MNGVNDAKLKLARAGSSFTSGYVRTYHRYEERSSIGEYKVDAFADIELEFS